MLRVVCSNVDSVMVIEIGYQVLYVVKTRFIFTFILKSITTNNVSTTITTDPASRVLSHIIYEVYMQTVYFMHYIRTYAVVAIKLVSHSQSNRCWSGLSSQNSNYALFDWYPMRHVSEVRYLGTYDVSHG